ncbi:MAG: DNA/RNA helicase domain-containing protein [Thermoanaerobaculia bacterium]
MSAANWLHSSFRPSSSIIDATLSLYGNHDVAAIEEHSAPAVAIRSTTLEVRSVIDQALDAHEYHVIFVSGAPGAGKTLVGLDLAMRGIHAGSAVFLTGNVPLVDVLHKALRASYREQSRAKDVWVRTGYRRTDAAIVANAATYKIVKAHSFLGRRGRPHRQEDGRVLIFDEAQRTYQSGRMVAGEKLADHEADLILKVQRDAHPTGGAVVVALVGHNQAINRGERGLVAWLQAAERNEWGFSIADETLRVEDVGDVEYWATHQRRKTLHHGHLRQSMRYYRNSAVEEWVNAVLDDQYAEASGIARQMEAKEDAVWIARDLAAAKQWARRRIVGTERAGLIASGQARRLAAEGLFVDFKPDIATWMLAPTTDVRSSNSLEIIQNQYQVQGLELDYTIACWDADLRREGGGWKAYKMSGTEWRKDHLLAVAKNGYRVILTRARKGMIIFVPRGDVTGADVTRTPSYYDAVAEYLSGCGAKHLPN